MIVENLKNFIDAAVQVAVGAQEGLQHYLCSPVVLTKRIVYAVLNLTLSYNSTVALDDWIQDAEMHTIVFQIRPEVTVAVKIRETQLSLPTEDIRVQINVSRFVSTFGQYFSHLYLLAFCWISCVIFSAFKIQDDKIMFTHSPLSFRQL